MAFIDTAPGTNLPVFFNVDHAVGKNCPNVTNDVKLIQYLLKTFYSKAVNIGLAKPTGDMVVDGLCGPTTMTWITKFQMDFSKRNPGVILLDSRFDRIRNKDFIGSISGTKYSLGVLNASTLKQDPNGFAMTPYVVPMDNPNNVPPPSADMVMPEVNVPESGGV